MKANGIVRFLNIVVALGMGRYLFSMLVPQIRNAYALSYTQIGILSSSVLTGYLIGAYTGGVALHRFPGRVVPLGAVCGLAIGFLAYAVSAPFAVLLPASVIMGAGSATLFMSVFPDIVQESEPVRYGRSMGRTMSGVGTGVVLIALLSAIPWSGSSITRVWGSALVLTLGALLLNLLVQRASEPVTDERRLPHYAHAWVRLVRTPALRYLLIAYFLFGVSYSAFLNYILANLSERSSNVDLPWLHIWFSFGLLSIIGSFSWGQLFDSFSRKRVILWNYVLCGTGIAIVAISTTRAVGYIGTALFAVSLIGYVALVSGYILILTGSWSSVFAGKFTLVHGIGQVFGAFFGGLIRDLTGGFSVVFIAVLVVHFLSLVAFMAVRDVYFRGPHVIRE